MAMMYGVMKRTTIFLSEDQKRNLKRIAQETGRSESDLIRDGVNEVVARHTPPFPKPHLGTFDSGDPGWTDPDNLDRLMEEGFGRD